MSSELERRTAIIVALRCGCAPKEIIDFFKFPKATVYSIVKSFKELEDIEEGFLTPERTTPDRSQVRKRSADFIDRLQTITSLPMAKMSTKEVYLYVMQTVVKPWMTQIAAGRPYIYQPDGAPAHTSNLVLNCCLENPDMFWSKELWPPSSPDLNPATTTSCSQHCGLLESCHHPGRWICRWEVQHRVEVLCERKKLD
ncbi:Transposable element tcb2 transposase [Caligus rogercresseyi]|uniref:Transposable element tcb2 transposase n=1 Tax=Caligus rogercresseyi TaxID=217165 RepID=A0A7T8JVT2_CALRO|nr:Transposable element tcb2 transposase [Caligus rogercresseyi]